MNKVVVVGGGNAGLTAAIEAAERGDKVILLEIAPPPLRGGNTKYTRDIRYAHGDEDEYTSGSYNKSELKNDLLDVSGKFDNPEIAEFVIDHSDEEVINWMVKHKIKFRKAMRGVLHMSRTNAFMLGGGRVIIDTYHAQLKKLGANVVYEAPVISVDIKENEIRSITALINNERRKLTADKYIFASGGIDANKEWLSQFWGERIKYFHIRGSRFNTGLPLKALIENGALTIGEGKAGHIVAVDARSLEHDAGIVSRVDAIPWGIVVNKRGERFYDEGEDIWPKRYAIWGRLIAEQESQIAYVIIDSKVIGRFIPPYIPPITADSIEELASKLNLDPKKLSHLVSEFNRGIIKKGREPYNWSNHKLPIPKSHWAIPLDSPPFYAYPLAPGLTFTYLSVRINKTGRIMTSDGELENGFAAGEIASGNVLRYGYLGGYGLTIGHVLGRLAGGAWGNE